MKAPFDLYECECGYLTQMDLIDRLKDDAFQKAACPRCKRHYTFNCLHKRNKNDVLKYQIKH